jgi:undecaprenyl-diphosphatase
MLKYVVLGIIQGLTEFLPVSSSAHLVILQKLFGMSGEEIALSVVLHLGTLLALCIFFFRDILDLFTNLKWILLIIIVTVITGTIGVSGKDFFEGLFASVKLTAIALLITGLILILTRRFRRPNREMLGLTDALCLGVTQGLAIIPGISRSGITISTLLFRRLSWETSFKFSFLASIPAILGATLLEAKKINFAAQGKFGDYAAGFIFSFITGLLALGVLKWVLRRGRLDYFGYYCIILAVATLLFIK